MSNGISEPVGENDEAVRCICGSDDYPGPPQITEEDSKRGLKDGAEPDLLSPEDYTDDLAGFFLQCDICKVWQHGGCVGIKNEDMSPDEYFCELCRKDLHKIYTASNGYVSTSTISHSRDKAQSEFADQGCNIGSVRHRQPWSARL